jgi:hypothetical protein
MRLTRDPAMLKPMLYQPIKQIRCNIVELAFLIFFLLSKFLREGIRVWYLLGIEEDLGY